MSSSPPSPAGSTGITSLTLGSALTATSLTAPVTRSATRADLLSLPMISPLVLSRQPCITPGAGHTFGNGSPGSGGGGGGVVLVPGCICGSVVNGSDCAASNRAHPDPTSKAVHTSVSTPSIGRRNVMLARLRIAGQSSPRRAARIGVSRLCNGGRTRRANPRLAGDKHLRWVS